MFQVTILLFVVSEEVPSEPGKVLAVTHSIILHKVYTYSVFW